MYMLRMKKDRGLRMMAMRVLRRLNRRRVIFSMQVDSSAALKF
jgi:hypothetical protein